VVPQTVISGRHRRFDVQRDEIIPCLIAYWTSSELVVILNSSMIPDLAIDTGSQGGKGKRSGKQSGYQQGAARTNSG
jgi:hypothetical protein